MKILSALLLILCLPPSLAADVDASVATLYFTADEAKVAAAQVERAEDNLTFPAPRDPRQLAREFARAELANGNVCLGQAERDLKAALRSKKISKMCETIYKADLAEAGARARRAKKRVAALECEAAVEARETSAAIGVVLSFRGAARIADRVPEKLARAGVKNEPETWTFAPFEAPIGEGQGWKGILLNRSCSLDAAALDRHFNEFLRQARAERALVRCRELHAEDAARLARLQDRLRQYVPDEWMKDVAGDDLPSLFTPAGDESFRTLASCRAAREGVAEKEEELADLSESIASKHDVPALLQAGKRSGRSPASFEEEELD